MLSPVQSDHYSYNDHFDVMTFSSSHHGEYGYYLTHCKVNYTNYLMDIQGICLQPTYWYYFDTCMAVDNYGI